MLRTTQCVSARPWRPDDGLGIAGKDRRNCLWSLDSGVKSWVACHRCPLTSQLQASVCAVGHLNFSSTVGLSTHPLSHAIIPLWHWPSFTVLHLAVATSMASSAYFSDTGWREHDGPAGDHWFSHTRRPSEPPVCRISCQRSSSPIGSYEIWNPVHYRSWPLQRGSVGTQQTDVTVRDAPSHIWKLFCMYGSVKFLTYADVIDDTK